MEVLQCAQVDNKYNILVRFFDNILVLRGPAPIETKPDVPTYNFPVGPFCFVLFCANIR